MPHRYEQGKRKEAGKKKDPEDPPARIDYTTRNQGLMEVDIESSSSSSSDSQTKRRKAKTSTGPKARGKGKGPTKREDAAGSRMAMQPTDGMQQPTSMPACQPKWQVPSNKIYFLSSHAHLLLPSSIWCRS